MNNVKIGGVALLGGGFLFLWSGYHGAHITGSLRDLLQGKQPAPGGDLGIAGSSTGTASSPGQLGAPAAPASVSGNVANAKMQAAGFGWTGNEWDALYALWTGESGFRNDAQNPTSTAYGIAQFLDSTWGPYGPKTSDPTLQIRYGLEYIRDRYGSPSAAYAAWLSRSPHWY